MYESGYFLAHYEVKSGHHRNPWSTGFEWLKSQMVVMREDDIYCWCDQCDRDQFRNVELIPLYTEEPLPQFGNDVRERVKDVS